MNFLQLLDGAEVLAQSGNPSVSGLEYDSRRVKPGDAFIAMRGETSDGNKFIDKAINAGAVGNRQRLRELRNRAKEWLGRRCRTDAGRWRD